jgi:hypothetical protein
VALSEEFVNELVARTFLMGLDSEAGTLRVFFRRLAAVPSRRHPSDTKFGPDKNLWKGLVTRTVDLAKFDTASEAAASIDSLLNTFRIVCRRPRASISRRSRRTARPTTPPAPTTTTIRSPIITVA